MEPSLNSISASSKEYDVRFYYGFSNKQFADLYIPKGVGPFPVVIGIHGGWWKSEYDLSTHSHLCNWFKDNGIAAWNIEYRRVNNKLPAWPYCGEDVMAAINYLNQVKKEYNLDINNCCIIGFSAGAQLAAWATHRYSSNKNTIKNVIIKKTISLAGAVDLAKCDELKLGDFAVRKFFGINKKPSLKLLKQACPSKLGMTSVPIHIIHGLLDTSIPACVSEEYFKKLLSNNSLCKLDILTKATHFQLIDPNSLYWPIVSNIVFSTFNVTQK
ncbi:MAG: acetyl esterase/lipase [Crocinitomicaceae bacterium]|jgi:acetyl esterase/lipase